jgi:hypothetical protein
MSQQIELNSKELVEFGKQSELVGIGGTMHVSTLGNVSFEILKAMTMHNLLGYVVL